MAQCIDNPVYDMTSWCRGFDLRATLFADGECRTFLGLLVSLPLVMFLGLLQMYLEFFLDLIDLAHSVGSCGSGGADRYGWIEMGVEATVCIEWTSEDMVNIVVRKLCLW
ncbi:hypothetical protein KIL84_013535 [Mauremys mutica]|uniref:Uncharacterized protein n=1 Tax=Mauremys mutica TaxID=74926 RepID=A0A9D4AUF2_9SAUR|nr:hypothetical protein KIL84_013535 [Mauremys mutica]